MSLANFKPIKRIIKAKNVNNELDNIVKELHDFDNISEILDYIGSEVKFYLQNYRDCDTVLKKGLNGFSDDELLNIQKNLERKYPNVIIRGRGKR